MPLVYMVPVICSLEIRVVYRSRAVSFTRRCVGRSKSSIILIYYFVSISILEDKNVPALGDSSPASYRDVDEAKRAFLNPRKTQERGGELAWIAAFGSHGLAAGGNENLKEAQRSHGRSRDLTLTRGT